jgi:Uma2 family endonuclease
MHGTLVDMKPAAVSVRYAVRAIPEAWILPEGNVPESIPHGAAARYLELVLGAWAERSSRNVHVARNLAIRWVQELPKVGVDPDICLLEPPPPGVDDLRSLRLWEPGHLPPPLCIEVVSTTHPSKDYATIQDRYAAMGTTELVVFDPLLAGPAALGGPVLLQLWRRDDSGTFERIHFGDDPVFSRVLEAWLVPEGRGLRIKDALDRAVYWLTGEERERAEKEAALARIAELERRARGGTDDRESR